MERVSYTPSQGGRFFYLLLFAAFAAAAVVLVVVTVRNDAQSPPLPFTVIWIVALGWNGYWWLWRASYRLEVRDGLLLWMTPLRRGQVPLRDVIEIRPSALTSQLSVIALREGPSVVCLAVNGFSEFAAVVAGGSGAAVRMGLSERLSRTLGTRNAFKREE